MVIVDSNVLEWRLSLISYGGSTKHSPREPPPHGYTFQKHGGSWQWPSQNKLTCAKQSQCVLTSFLPSNLLWCSPAVGRRMRPLRCCCCSQQFSPPALEQPLNRRARRDPESMFQTASACIRTPVSVYLFFLSHANSSLEATARH